MSIQSCTIKRTRRKFSASFKTKVALKAIKERLTTQELTSKFEVHSNQISQWKKKFPGNASAAFETKREDEKTDIEKNKKNRSN
jgi:transposase